MGVRFSSGGFRKNASFIHHPDGIVQDGSKTHPRNVRHHQPRCRARNRRKPEYRDEDGGEQEYNFHEREGRRMKPEKKDRPPEVEEKLQRKNQFGVFLFLFRCVAFPYKPKRRSHEEIQKSPYRTKNVPRRIPRRLVQGIEPGIHVRL